MADHFQVDLSHNHIMDKYELQPLGAKFQYDINGDGKIDEMDSALASYLLPKGK
jgi:hypothetical protein